MDAREVVRLLEVLGEELPVRVDLVLGAVRAARLVERGLLEPGRDLVEVLAKRGDRVFECDEHEALPDLDADGREAVRARSNPRGSSGRPSSAPFSAYVQPWYGQRSSCARPHGPSTSVAAR